MNATVMRIGWRTMTGRRRGLVLLLLPALLVAISVVVSALADPSAETSMHILQDLGTVVIVPLVALIATSSVIVPELEDGSIAYLLAKPISRLSIVLSKAVVILGVTLVCGVAPIVVSSFILQPGDSTMATALAVGATTMAIAYTALFTALATSTRHAIIAGIAYIFLWEGLLARFMPGIRWLSIQRWGFDLVNDIRDVTVVRGDLPLAYSVTALAVVTVAGVLWGARRLSRYNLTGED